MPSEQAPDQYADKQRADDARRRILRNILLCLLEELGDLVGKRAQVSVPVFVVGRVGRFVTRGSMIRRSGRG